ncbi:MAG: hypothetical protein LBP55_02230 [Candidatus Adiutrix sp.]|jgi:hypothetical protein|nr:hypothetical protein [Candidatus Adiutrix sp.]
MAIESVGGSSYQFSALRVDPHPGLESKFQKYRREHDLAAKQEEQGKFQYQTSKALEEAQSVAQEVAESGDKYTAHVNGPDL